MLGRAQRRPLSVPPSWFGIIINNSKAEEEKPRAKRRESERGGKKGKSEANSS